MLTIPNLPVVVVIHLPVVDIIAVVAALNFAENALIAYDMLSKEGWGLGSITAH